MSRRSTAAAGLDRVRALVDQALAALDHINALYWIFGISHESVPTAARLFAFVREKRNELDRLAGEARRRGGRGVLLNEADLLTTWRAVLSQIEDTKQLLRNGPVRVHCSDSEVKRLAHAVKANGVVELSKEEITARFDVRRFVPAWSRIPEYTRFFVGARWGVASPEYDLCLSMCWFNNEALRTSGLAREQLSRLSSGDGDPEQYRAIGEEHSIVCRQAVICAFLLIEAHLNGLSSAYLSASGSLSLSEEERLWLRERVRDSAGRERVRFVSVENKAHEWVKLMSPRRVTFDKGGPLFQRFMRAKEYRDAVVHVSSSKAKRFRSVDMAVATEAVRTAIEMIEAISRFVSLAEAVTEYPWWLPKQRPDGSVEAPRIIDMEALAKWMNSASPTASPTVSDG